MADIVDRLRAPAGGVVANTQIIFAAREGADQIERLRKLLHDQFDRWHDVDCKYDRHGVMVCTCGHDDVATALRGTGYDLTTPTTVDPKET